MTTDALAIAEQLFAAIEAGDVDAVAALYVDDVAVWHNFDDVAQTKEQNLATVAWMTRRVSGLRYEVQSRIEVPGGVIQQHILHGTAPGGEALEIPACMRLYIDGGRITRIEEYLDPAQAAVLQPSNAELARRFFDAVLARDLAGALALCSEDATMWSAGAGPKTLPAKVLLPALMDVAAKGREFAYEDVRCESTPTGFVEEHTVAGRTLSGEGFRFPVCIVGTIANGKIAAMREYLDPAHAAALAG
jgi:uncharacterized protein